MQLFWIYFVCFIGWFIGGIMGGATGIGAMMIALPIIAFAVPPEQAILISCLTGVVGCFQLAYAYRHYYSWPDIRMLIFGAIPGCIMGVLALKVASVAMLEMMIAFMLACFITLQLFSKANTYRLPDTTPVALGAGIACGFVASSVAMVGAPLGIYAMLRGWDPNRARGNLTAFYIFAALSAAIMQALSGLYTVEICQYAISAIIGCFLGQMLGVSLGRHIGVSLFKRILLIFLGIAAIALFLRALQAM